MPLTVDELSPSNHILSQLQVWMLTNNQAACIELLKNLEKFVYNKNAFNDNKMNLLIFACQERLTELALYVIRKEKTNLEATETTSRATALMWACSEGLTEVVKELLKYKCAAGYANERGDTALIFAADKYNIDILYKLISYSIDTKININEFQINNVNETALDYLLTDDYREHINKATYIKSVNWLISRYQETDPTSEVLQRNIDRICADPELKKKLKISCARPRQAEAVVGVEIGKKLGSPKTRGQKATGSKRTTAKNARPMVSAKAIPLALAVREPGEDTGFNVDLSDDEGELVSPRR